MKKMKNNLDERQELKLLKIEHNGCWMAFWGLLLAIVIQQALGQGGMKNIAGEWVVFMCLAIYLMIGCMRNGIWDRKLKPDFKTNLVASVLAGAAIGVFWFFVSYHNYHSFVGSLATGAFMCFAVGVLCFIALTIASGVYKKRVQKLEELEDDPEDIK